MKHYNSTQCDFIMHYIIISLSMHETLQQSTTRFYNALHNISLSMHETLQQSTTRFYNELRNCITLYMKHYDNTQADFIMHYVITSLSIHETKQEYETRFVMLTVISLPPPPPPKKKTHTKKQKTKNTHQ